MTHNIPIAADITLTPTSNYSVFKNYLAYIPESEKISRVPAQYHNVTATILEPLPIFAFSIPQEYLLPLYGLIPSFLIPAVIRMINAKRQRGYASKYRKMIDETFSRFHDKSEECVQTFERIKSQIIVEYEKGRLSESHYQMLNERISDFTRKLE